MSRYARQYKGDVLYRAVVEYSSPDGGSGAYYLGPYDTHGKAQGRLTQAVGNPPRPGCELSRVEVARPEWIDPSKPREDVVTIPRAEFERLGGDSAFLETLFAHGLDSWDGYAAAHADHESAARS